MKVLLIDDEPDIRKIGQLSLEALGGWRVLAAGSAPEGIEAAKQHQPDLILLDMMMPGMDGLQALATLRAAPEVCHIPVIFMTAKVQRGEVEKYLESGAVGVVQKPFNPMTLAEEIRKILSSCGKLPIQV
jgi:CheY-like chemotaxis protein